MSIRYSIKIWSHKLQVPSIDNHKTRETSTVDVSSKDEFQLKMLYVDLKLNSVYLIADFYFCKAKQLLIRLRYRKNVLAVSLGTSRDRLAFTPGRAPDGLPGNVRSTAIPVFHLI